MTTEIGMRAYATDFGATRKAKPFAGHRRKSTVDANAEEAAHAMGVAQERARFGQRGQRQHFGRVRLTQPDDAGVPFVGRRHGRMGDHLHARGDLDGDQSGGNADFRHLQDEHLVGRWHQAGQGFQSGITVVARGGEAIDARLVTSRQFIAE